MTGQHLVDLDKNLVAWFEDCFQPAEALGEIRDAVSKLESILSTFVDNSNSSAWLTDLDEDWQTEDSQWIGKRVRRIVFGENGEPIKSGIARIVAWIPKETSDYTDEKGKPAALWHVVWEDGSEMEDMEEFEVIEGIRMLEESGENSEVPRAGIWETAVDREMWMKQAETARTTGGLAVAAYLLGDRCLEKVGNTCKDIRREAEDWDEFCTICSDGGNLMLCESCPHTSHLHCVGLSKVPKTDWYCNDCLLQRVQDEKTNEGAKDAKAASKNGSKTGSKKAAPEDTRASRSNPKSTSQNAKPDTKDSLEKLRKMLIRQGALNGAVAEISPDGRAGKRGERWFVQVVNGDIMDKGDDPKITEAQYFTPWKPREAKKMTMEKATGPISVSSILGIGDVKELLAGDSRKGFTPLLP
eukprot:CAMPEP_0184290008 /NCGR_PEP_ID=MMETSP1049-20130417/2356_1 /TAXON_ID=77928 /ORGANISM="Proteomonas sulcata, Strain CCMP704" /LENGTH=412 /DNA_ID=CAMNT_0026597021 /DNA_START=120 /DNA_END=1358 /DNA_ORIENTATION=-